MDDKIFFDKVRASLFGGRLSAGQTAGLIAILGRARAEKTPTAHLAYILATPFHETATTMQPIIETRSARETKNPRVETAIKRLDKSFAAGKLPWVRAPYWRKDAAGKSWLGRGFVQLTHMRNYQAMSAIIGVDLVADPSKALEIGPALGILFEGMTRGTFTGHSLSDYLDGRRADYRGARRIINGTESAEKVEGYALKFEAALLAAGYAPGVSSPAPKAEPVHSPDPVPAPVVPAAVPAVVEKLEDEKLDKSLLKSKTFWQWVITTILAPVLAVLSNPYVQALIIVIIAGFAAYAIKRRNDLKNIVRDVKAGVDA